MPVEDVVEPSVLSSIIRMPTRFQISVGDLFCQPDQPPNRTGELSFQYGKSDRQHMTQTSRYALAEMFGLVPLIRQT